MRLPPSNNLIIDNHTSKRRRFQEHWSVSGDEAVPKQKKEPLKISGAQTVYILPIKYL
jgi:hypothetical protein